MRGLIAEMSLLPPTPHHCTPPSATPKGVNPADSGHLPVSVCACPRRLWARLPPRVGASSNIRVLHGPRRLYDSLATSASRWWLGTVVTSGSRRWCVACFHGNMVAGQSSHHVRKSPVGHSSEIQAWPQRASARRWSRRALWSSVVPFSGRAGAVLRPAEAVLLPVTTQLCPLATHGPV